MSDCPNHSMTGRIYVDLGKDGKYILFSATYECELHLVLLTHENRKKNHLSNQWPHPGYLNPC